MDLQKAISITGVTVGIGPVYEELARLAACCFEQWTGAPALVLGARELASSQVDHPAGLRLQVFDYTSADIVVYFDADWFCLGPWSPPIDHATSAVFACRDFVLTSEWPRQQYEFDSPAFLDGPVDAAVSDQPIGLRQDYVDEVRRFADLSSPPTQWINTGLMVLRRSAHVALLSTALENYQSIVGHHPEYFEQPAFNRAIETLGVPCRLLARKFNVLAARPTKWPAAVVGLHIKPKRHEEFLGAIRERTITTPDDVRRYFCEAK